jgi:uncharacterized 2Fe-2S/4Fe-4S cluster protein (DUF4445 family)
MRGIFPEGTQISLPPLIGGFVGSDALACLAYFGFEDPPGPMAAIDLGTNGEVMITDGRRIVTGSPYRRRTAGRTNRLWAAERDL